MTAPTSSRPAPLRYSCILVLLALSACSSPTQTAVEPGTAITRAEALDTFDATWETIRDQHYDEDLNGVDWDAVREELRPQVETVETQEELRVILTDMVDRLGQSHFVVIPKEATPDHEADEDEDRDVAGGLGLDVRLCDGKVLVFEVEEGGAAAEAGVHPGWVLTGIGARDTAEMLDSKPAGMEQRKFAFQVREGVRHMTFGPVGSEVELRFLDGNDEPVELSLIRGERSEEATTFGNLPTFHVGVWTWDEQVGPLSVGRLRFSQWFLPAQRRIDEAIDAFRDRDGIIVDLRGNSGGAGAMVMGLAGHFFEDRVPLGVMKTRESEVDFIANPRFTNTDGDGVDPYAGPVAVIVDETSASASELFAAGIQSTGRARVFGVPTAGAALPSKTVRLPSGDVLLHAFGDFVTSSGTRPEGPGVQPDVRVPLTRAALLEGEDPQLEAALEWISTQVRP